jgi:hypothetical protein
MSPPAEPPDRHTSGPGRESGAFVRPVASVVDPARTAVRGRPVALTPQSGGAGLGSYDAERRTIVALIRSAFARLSLAVLIASLLAGCSLLHAAAPAVEGTDGVWVSNGTTLLVTLVVNGSAQRAVPPGSEVRVPAAELPPLPWSIEARMESGRVLASLTVRAGDVASGPGWSKGDGVRVDLSCGRLDVWSGPPLLGPMNGPGAPGDCDP